MWWFVGVATGACGSWVCVRERAHTQVDGVWWRALGGGRREGARANKKEDTNRSVFIFILTSIAQFRDVSFLPNQSQPRRTLPNAVPLNSHTPPAVQPCRLCRPLGLQRKPRPVLSRCLLGPAWWPTQTRQLQVSVV